MKRTLMAGLTAAALALLPPAAAPARADGGEGLLGLLLGIGAVHAIGKGIEQARKPAVAPLSASERIGEPHRLAPGHAWNAPHRTLPRTCLATFDTWHGEIRGFSADCLARTMRRAERLPRLCAIETRVEHRTARIYSARCLQLEGWQVSRAQAGWEDRPAWGWGYRPGP